MKFTLIQEVEADNILSAFAQFGRTPVLIAPATEEVAAKPPRSVAESKPRHNVQPVVLAALQNKGKEQSSVRVAQDTGLSIKQVSNALTNLRNKGEVKNNARGWYRP